MAADIFESYEVTIVAAMILGMSTFGHKGVIFPLLVRGIGVLGSLFPPIQLKPALTILLIQLLKVFTAVSGLDQ